MRGENDLAPVLVLALALLHGFVLALALLHGFVLALVLVLVVLVVAAAQTCHTA